MIPCTEPQNWLNLFIETQRGATCANDRSRHHPSGLDRSKWTTPFARRSMFRASISSSIRCLSSSVGMYANTNQAFTFSPIQLRNRHDFLDSAAILGCFRAQHFGQSIGNVLGAQLRSFANHRVCNSISGRAFHLIGNEQSTHSSSRMQDPPTAGRAGNSYVLAASPERFKGCL